MVLFSKHKKEAQDLDIPPPPTMSEAPEMDVPELDDLPPLPDEMPKMKDDLDFSQEEFSEPPVPEPIQEPMQEEPVQEVVEEHIDDSIPNEIPDLDVPSEPVAEPTNIEEPVRVEKKAIPDEIFIDAKGQANVLGYIESIKAGNTEVQEMFEKLNTIKNTADKAYEKLHVGLEEIERKLLYVDKILFD